MESSSLVTLDWDSANKKISIADFPLKSLEKVLNTILPDESLGKINDWEFVDDIEILEKFKLGRFASTVLYAITDISYSKNIGIFEIQIQEFEKFITSYCKEFGECFFNGDVIFILPHDNAVFLFHHDGELFSYNLPLKR